MRIQRTLPPAAAPVFVRDAVRGVAGFFATKARLAKLEADIREYFGVRHVFLVSSGKAALTLILRALSSLSPRKKVLIPDYTCFSVPSAIRRAGLSVSLCDIDPTTLDFNYARLRESLDDQTLCIVPTHLFGLPSDIARVQSLAREKQVFVVEDAAQAMGETCDGKLLGTHGDVGFVSLGRGKNITCGSGGIILTDSDVIGSAIRAEYAMLKARSIPEKVKTLLEVLAISVFIHPRLYWLPDGLPFLKLGETRFSTEFPISCMDGVAAAILRDWKERLDLSRRSRSIAARDLARRMPRHMQVVRSLPSDEATYLRLPALAPNAHEKASLLRLSRRAGLGISASYPTPIHAIEEFTLSFSPADFPGATTVAQRLVTLPVHHLVHERDRNEIVSLIASAVGSTCTAATQSAANTSTRQ